MAARTAPAADASGRLAGRRGSDSARRSLTGRSAPRGFAPRPMTRGRDRLGLVTDQRLEKLPNSCCRLRLRRTSFSTARSKERQRKAWLIGEAGAPLAICRLTILHRYCTESALSAANTLSNITLRSCNFCFVFHADTNTHELLLQR